MQLMFPRALEILLDFSFFDIDEGKYFTNAISSPYQRTNSYAAILYYGISMHKIKGTKQSTSSTLSVLVAGLNRLSAEQDHGRIDAFSGHLSKVNCIRHT